MFRRHSWPSFNVWGVPLCPAQPVDHVWRVISNQAQYVWGVCVGGKWAARPTNPIIKI